jgi:hypothetical protein
MYWDYIKRRGFLVSERRALFFSEKHNNNSKNETHLYVGSQKNEKVGLLLIVFGKCKHSRNRKKVSIRIT